MTAVYTESYVQQFIDRAEKAEAQLAEKLILIAGYKTVISNFCAEHERLEHELAESIRK